MARKYSFAKNDDLSIAIALELVEGMDPVSVIGISDPLAADTETDVSLLGVTTIPLPNNAGQIIQVWSTDAGDNQQIEVSGLGANGILIDTQTVTLNGVTPVDLPVNMSRINFAQNVSLTPVVGTINIGVSPATIFCNILPANQRSKQAIYSVSVGYTLIVPTLIASLKRLAGGGNQDVAATMQTKIKSFDQSFFYRGIPFDLVRQGSSLGQFIDLFPDAIIGPADIKLSVTANLANTEVIGRLNGVLVKT